MENKIQEKNNLENAISKLYDMELNTYLMVRTISRLKKQADSLGYSRSFSQPQPRKAIVSGGSAGVGAGLGTVICAFLGVASGCSNSSGLFSSIGNAIKGLFIGGIAGLIVGTVIGFIIDKVKCDEEQDRLDSEYNSAMTQYNNQVNQDKRRVQRELKQKNILLAEIDALENKLKKSRHLTTVMYDAAGIDRDFRTLIAIGYMYDFLRLGITDKLTGADGLYYLIRKEIRWDILNTTLENISQKLDTIISNQDRIYHELCSINQKSDEIISQTGRLIAQGVERDKTLDEIRQNSEITAYNAERTRVEQEYWHLIHS